MKIKILPPHLANKIAAGEVVERPASVVKELLENSLDAGADEIVINIENGGLKKIKIADNGCGMSVRDAKMSFERHATSKISCEADLYSIKSLGFRGEAIASIASVAMIKLQTRQKGDVQGVAIENNGGSIFSESACGCPEGTIFEIENLFFNTPARKKFLKTLVTEFGHISAVVLQAALGFCDKAFILTHNDQLHYNLPGGQTLNERIYSLLGKEIFENLIPIEEEGSEITISGFIVSPSVNRNSRKHQYLFVNQRAVQSAAISKAIQDAFHSLLPSGRYPIFIINLKINPLEVDVNIHPRKLEVRFLHQQEVYSFVKKAVKSVLESHNLTPDIFLEPAPRPRSSFASYLPGRHVDEKNVRNAFDFTKNFSSSYEKQLPPSQLFGSQPEQFGISTAEKFGTVAEITSSPQTKLKPVAQIRNSYIIAEDEDGLVLIDQHAAHERINYMKLMKSFEIELSEGLVKQQLLTPISVNLTLQQASALTDSREIFETLGFEVEHFGENCYLIRSVPTCLNKVAFDDLIVNILDDLVSDQVPQELEKKREHIINYIACRSSIKFGRPLEYAEQIKLIFDLENLTQKYSCPHGRPTMIRLSFQELEKKFGRL